MKNTIKILSLISLLFFVVSCNKKSDVTPQTFAEKDYEGKVSQFLNGKSFAKYSLTPIGYTLTKKTVTTFEVRFESGSNSYTADATCNLSNDGKALIFTFNDGFVMTFYENDAQPTYGNFLSTKVKTPYTNYGFTADNQLISLPKTPN